MRGSLCKRTPAVRSQSPRSAGVRVEPNGPNTCIGAGLELCCADRCESVPGRCGQNSCFAHSAKDSSSPAYLQMSGDRATRIPATEHLSERPPHPCTGRDSGSALARPVLLSALPQGGGNGRSPRGESKSRLRLAVPGEGRSPNGPAIGEQQFWWLRPSL